MRHVQRSFVARAGVGVTANVVQRSSLRISEVAVDHAALILLRHGVKTVRSGTRQWTARSGDAIAVAGGQTLDIRNQLSEQGWYEARWIVWDPVLLESVQGDDLLRSPKPTRAALVPAVGPDFAAAVDRAVRAIENAVDIPMPVARHTLAELLVWLREAGIVLSSRQPRTAVARLRSLFAGSLASDWTLPDAADRLATSPSTLRRRLAAEGTTFGQVLSEARMAYAMTMIQTSDRAIQHIASDVGYESASRFAVRFRSRFGLAPSALRGHAR